MEQLKSIKTNLISQVQSQMGNLQAVNTKELGEVIDMIKDLSEAIYYCAIYEKMEEAEGQTDKVSDYRYYTEKYLPYIYYPPEYYRDMDRDYGKMYYTDGNNGGGHTNMYSESSRSSGRENSNYTGRGDRRGYFEEMDYPMNLHDEREGRSPIKRKMYMESKEMNKDTQKKIKDLENYMQDLTSDMVEMITGASDEEKQILQKKVNSLALKLQNV